MGYKRLTPLALVSLLALTGCQATDPGPTFEETCQGKGGVVMDDTTSKLMTGMVTGTIIGSNGQMGTGSGMVTSLVSFKVSLCIQEGKVIDMQVE